ncbi:ribbon-helix-helix protein, CopG family [Agrococcus sp. Ld7]|uniref:ribbon-helix-helix protein, CopG family n=1 Tax=Agrococcus sp. Ld7 TaxID=649148 RepID=UPI00386ADC7B
MDANETIRGVPVTEEQIAEWSAEAEAGYGTAELRKRGRGRPGRGESPSQVVTVRLTPTEIAAVDAQAAQHHKTRSEFIRDVLAAAVA